MRGNGACFISMGEECLLHLNLLMLGGSKRDFNMDMASSMKAILFMKATSNTASKRVKVFGENTSKQTK